MAIIYARLMKQFMFEYHIIFSASLHKFNEEGQRNDEVDLFINLNINLKLSEPVIDYIDVKSQLEHQIQIQGTKESGWIS